MTMPSDPFSSVRAKGKNALNPSKKTSIPEDFDENQKQNQDDHFSSVRLKKSEDFPEVFETGRHAARIGSRIAETIGGIPGDISSLIQSGVFSGLEAIGGHKASKEALDSVKKMRAPTSHELKELSQDVTGGFTKAQGPTEQAIDEFTETVASLLGPMKFRKVLGVSLAANAAKQGVKLAGLGEGSQEASKIGTMFLASLYNPRGAMKYASSQYDKAKQLSKGASINAESLNNNVSTLIKDLEKGVSTSEKNSVLRPAKEILEKIGKNGKISVDELTSAKRDINKLMGEPDTLKGAKKLLKVLGKQIDDAIKPYEKLNPKFKEVYRPANEIYGAVMQGNKASNFIKNILGTKSVLGAVVGEVALGHPEYVLPTAAAAGSAFGGAKVVDFFTRMAKSPELQKFYSKAALAAAAEDAPALRLYSDKIDQVLEKSSGSSSRSTK